MLGVIFKTTEYTNSSTYCLLRLWRGRHTLLHLAHKLHHLTTSTSQLSCAHPLNGGAQLPLPELLRRHSRVLLEVSAEEREVAEVIVPRLNYLLFCIVLIISVVL